MTCFYLGSPCFKGLNILQFLFGAILDFFLCHLQYFLTSNLHTDISHQNKLTGAPFILTVKNSKVVPEICPLLEWVFHFRAGPKNWPWYRDDGWRLSIDYPMSNSKHWVEDPVHPLVWLLCWRFDSSGTNNQQGFVHPCGQSEGLFANSTRHWVLLLKNKTTVLYRVDELIRHPTLPALPSWASAIFTY